MTDATREGVSDEAEKKVITGNTARNEHLDALATRAKQERDAKLEEEGLPVIDTSAPVEEQEEEEPETPEQEADGQQESEEDQEEPDDLVTIIVDGVEQKVSQDKVKEAGIRALQKQEAADKRLEEATRLLNEAKQQNLAKAETQPSTDAEETPLPELDAEKLVNAIQYGDEQETRDAVKSLLEVIGRTQATPQATPELSQTQILQAISFKEGMDLVTSPPEKGGYSDLLEKPLVKKMFFERENELRDSGDMSPYPELYKRIGDEIREELNMPVPTQGGDELAKKREKKSQNQHVPAQNANAKATVGEDAPAPKTRQEKLDEMKRARHQG